MLGCAAVSAFLISSRRGRPGNDPIFALSKAAADRKAAGHDVVNATLGVLLDDEGRLAMLPSMTRALREVSPEQLSSYAPIAGPPAFLEAVKRDVLGTSMELLSRAVAVATPGGTGALRHAIVTFVDEGQSFLTTSHYWSPYQTIASEHGRQVQTFTMFRDDGSLHTAALDEALGAMLSKQGRATVILNDPCHNPTGYSMSEEDWKAVSAVLARHAATGPVSLLLDIAYAAFSEGSLTRPLRALANLSDKLLVGFAWSASKSFLAYGQRVGALVVIPPKKDDMADLEASLVFSCRGTWSNCNHSGMSAVTRLLIDPEQKRLVDEERRKASSLLAARVAAWNDAARPLGLRYPRYDGGFFVTVGSDDAPKHAAALRDRGMFVVPLGGSLRVALCSVATSDVARLARSMAEVLGPG
jgi:aromatic-amino-acid transaminase